MHNNRELLRPAANDGWERLSVLTGMTVGAKETGWDRLAQQILNDPTVRLRSIRRLEAVVTLERLLAALRDAHFTVLALRLGLTLDDQPIVEQSRRDVSERLQLSVSRIAQLEQEAIEELRAQVSSASPSLADFFYHVEDDRSLAG